MILTRPIQHVTGRHARDMPDFDFSEGIRDICKVLSYNTDSNHRRRQDIARRNDELYQKLPIVYTMQLGFLQESLSG